MTDTTPHDGTAGSNVQGDIKAAMEGTRTAAANVADSIKNAADNQSITYENAAVAANNVAGTIKDATANQGLTVANAKQAASNVAGSAKALADIYVENIKDTIARRSQSDYRMIMPLFCGFIITALLFGFHFTAPSTEPGPFAILVALVMSIGEPILSKALSVTSASPRCDYAHLSAGWLSRCLPRSSPCCLALQTSSLSLRTAARS
jgi:hypothetical protein